MWVIRFIISGKSVSLETNGPQNRWENTMRFRRWIPFYLHIIVSNYGSLQYSSQIVETDTASLEFSGKILTFTPCTFVLAEMCPLLPQCWATRILAYSDDCNTQINIGEWETNTSVSRFETSIVAAHGD